MDDSQIQAIVSQYEECAICKTKLTEYDEYYVNKSDAQFFVCGFCFGNIENEFS